MVGEGTDDDVLKDVSIGNNEVDIDVRKQISDGDSGNVPGKDAEQVEPQHT